MIYYYPVVSIIVLSLTVFLAFFIFFENRGNAINKNFTLLTLSATFWILVNFLTDISKGEFWVMFWSRATLIGPILIACFLYRFSVLFPVEKKINSIYWKMILVVAVIFIALSPTSLNISQVSLVEAGVPEISPGVLYIPFLLYFLLVVSFSFWNMLKGYFLSTVMEKARTRMVLFGIGISAFFGLLTNLLLPLLGDSSLVNFGPYFILFFLIFTAYAVKKHHLFNIKVIIAELMTFAIWTAVIAQAVMAETLNGKILGAVTFVFVIFIGIFLIKSVKKEVALREELEVANEKLKGLDKLKSEFLSLASHQLRSPLTAIKGYTSMLVEGSYGKLEEKQNEIVGHVQSIAQSMIGMVEDFLNVSKIEQGGMQYVFVPTDLSKMVATLFGEMKISAESKHLDFALEMDTTDTFTVNADAGKLKQVFLNLVDNSIKYTPSGFVHMSLVQNKEKNTVTFSVKDSGVGVSPETKEKLFQKFNRGEGGKLNTGGSGIGLYLAKEITEAHHGEIVIESEGLGKGSSFNVVLPRG